MYFITKLLNIPKGYENLVRYWGACHNAFALPIVLVDGMCKPFGLLRNYNCGKTMLFLLHCVIANVFFGFSIGNHFTKNAALIIIEEEQKKVVELELQELKLNIHPSIGNIETKRKQSNYSVDNQSINHDISILDHIVPEYMASNISEKSLDKENLEEKKEKKNVLQYIKETIFWVLDVFNNPNAKGIIVGACLAFTPGLKSIFFNIDLSPLYWLQDGLGQYAYKTGLFFNILLGVNIAIAVQKIYVEKSMGLLKLDLKTFFLMAINKLFIHSLSGLIFCKIMIWVFPSIFKNDLSLLYVNFTQWITPTPNVALILTQMYGVAQYDASFNCCIMMCLFPFTSMIATSLFFYFFGDSS